MQRRRVCRTINCDTGEQHLLKHIRTLNLPGSEAIVNQRQYDVRQDMDLKRVLYSPVYPTPPTDHLYKFIIADGSTQGFGKFVFVPENTKAAVLARTHADACHITPVPALGYVAKTGPGECFQFLAGWQGPTDADQQADIVVAVGPGNCVEVRHLHVGNICERGFD